MKSLLLWLFLCKVFALSAGFQWGGLGGGRWGAWSQWSTCSRTCGGGTTTRRRTCENPLSHSNYPKFILKIYRQHNRGNCRGPDVEYTTCNLQNCPEALSVTRSDAVTARAEQCAKFNGTSFNGRFFFWVPYLRAEDSKECELNCLAKGHKFFLRLRPHVEDGTPCLTDLKKICIKGRCEDPPHGCEGGKCFKKTRRLGQKRFGLFTSKQSKGNLVLGYNPVITIPSGSTNINITEMRRSKNYLALKAHNSDKYYLNGNWVIDLPRGYRIAGSKFYYKRPKRNQRFNEAIISKGPTNMDLDLMIIYQGDEPNIMYSYHLAPRKSPSGRRDPQAPAQPKTFRNTQGAQAPLNGRATLPRQGNGQGYGRQGPGGQVPGRGQVPGQSQIPGRGQIPGGLGIGRQGPGGQYPGGRGFGRQGPGGQNPGGLGLGRQGPGGQNPGGLGLGRQGPGGQNPGGLGLGRQGPGGQNPGGLGLGRQGPGGRNPGGLGLGRQGPGGQNPGGLGLGRQGPGGQNPGGLGLGRQGPGGQNPGGLGLGRQGPGGQNPGGLGLGRQDPGGQNPGGLGLGRQGPGGQNPGGGQGLVVPGSGRPRPVPGGQGGFGGGPLPKPGAYRWLLSGYTRCSHQCAGGLQTALYHCVRAVDNVRVGDSYCTRLFPKPDRRRVCNVQACPARWEPGKWLKCAKTCGKSIQLRNLLCKQTVDTNGRREVRMLPITNCPQWSRPSITRPCNLPPCPKPYNWVAEKWRPCSVTCGTGIQKRTVGCKDVEQNTTLTESECSKKPKPPTTQRCSPGGCKTQWFIGSIWSACSASCGQGVKERLVFCGRRGGNALPDDHCDKRIRPTSSRRCQEERCKSKWVISDWGKCSSACGKGVEARLVFCAGKVANIYQQFPVYSCKHLKKPIDERPCLIKECPPQWLVSNYNKCTKTCGGGSQSRDVMCLNDIGKRVGGCEISRKPSYWRKCNERRCPYSRRSRPTRPPKDTCKDESKGICMLIVQAHFCKIPSYGRRCCASCKKTRLS